MRDEVGGAGGDAYVGDMGGMGELDGRMGELEGWASWKDGRVGRMGELEGWASWKDDGEGFADEGARSFYCRCLHADGQGGGRERRRV
jgi:hypothetical protein